MPSRFLELRNRLIVYESEDNQNYLPPPVTRPRHPRTFFQKPATPFNPTAMRQQPNPRVPSVIAADSSATNPPRPRNPRAPSMAAADSSATNPPRPSQRATTPPAPRICEARAPLPSKPFSFLEEASLFFYITGHYPDVRFPKDWEAIAKNFETNFPPRSPETLAAKWEELMNRAVTIDYFEEAMAINQLSPSTTPATPALSLSHPQNFVIQLGIKPEPPMPKKNPAGEKKKPKHPPPGNGRTCARWTEKQISWLRKWCAANGADGYGNVRDWKKCAKDFRARFEIEHGRTLAALNRKWRYIRYAGEDGEAKEEVEEVAGNDYALEDGREYDEEDGSGLWTDDE
ncbi:hypothetical protein RUND412_006993 [Rhizina undulata]